MFGFEVADLIYTPPRHVPKMRKTNGTRDVTRGVATDLASAQFFCSLFFDHFTQIVEFGVTWISNFGQLGEPKGTQMLPLPHFGQPWCLRACGEFKWVFLSGVFGAFCNCVCVCFFYTFCHCFITIFAAAPPLRRNSICAEKA